MKDLKIIKNNKGSVAGVLAFLFGIVLITTIYIVFSPVIDELTSTGEEMLSEDSDGRDIIDLLNTIWYKLFIAIALIVLFIYMIADAIRKKQYNMQSY